MIAKVRFCTYESQTDKDPNQVELPLEEFYEMFAEHDETDCAPCPGGKCPQKDGLAWSPGWATERCEDRYVESFDLLAFEFDHLKQPQVDQLFESVDEFDCVVHSSHSHRPPDNQCLRLILTPSRRVMKREYPAVWQAFVRKYAPLADPKAKNPARIFFMPRVFKGGPRVNIRSPGKPVDIDALLADQARATRETKRAVVPPPPPERGETSLKDLRSALRRYNSPKDTDGTKREMVRRVLAGEPLADKAGRATVKFDGVTVYGRDDAVITTGYLAGLLMPVGTPAEAAMEVLRPSVSAMPRYEDDTEGEDPEGWLRKAQKHFDEGAEQKLAEASGRTQLVIAARAKGKPVGAETESEEGAESSEEESDENWELRIKHKSLKSGEVVPEQIGMNAAQALIWHPDWRGALRFNALTKEVECVGGPLPPNERAPEMLLTAVENWLQRNCDLYLQSHVVKAQLLYVARLRTYDPLKEYLEALKWDGAARLQTFFQKYCGARVRDDAGRDLTEYIQKVSTCWFIAAAARGLDPGCKMDNVLMLEGEPNIGKSKLVEALGGPFYTATHMTIGDKDSMLLAARVWLAEMAELSSMRAGETNRQKAFFSQRFDDFRVPYGAFIEKFPRRCMFVGTVNPDEEGYMYDRTGNRRFWCVYLEFVDYEAIARDRDQLFAEAVHRFRGGESFWFSKEESDKFDFIADQRLQTDSYTDVVWGWWVAMPPEKRPTEFKLYDVLCDALNLRPDQMGHAVRCGVGRTLKKLGFYHKQKRDGFTRSYIYESTLVLRGHPQVETRMQRKLRAIDGGKKDEKKEAK